ncbi:MAG: DUF1460 domain-containing protein [Saprospiraceae bacterium]|nr:DUF1460 domain-containing protein [Saprospiraceae bacterium]
MKKRSSLVRKEGKLGSRFYIPKSDVIYLKTSCNQENVAGITTDIKGLDIVHAGFVFKKMESLSLHASKRKRKCVL